MLILTRKTDQGIVFSGNVIVRILAVDGERVKIGIDAPRSVQVLREELVLRDRVSSDPSDDNDNDHSTSHDQPTTDESPQTPEEPVQRSS